jgi:hypothetical protein
MIFFKTFLLNEGGLFDFDLTFFAEIIEFILFSAVVTTLFLSPISKQLDERAEFINTNLRKSTILLSFGYERLITCVGLLTSEINELSRQIKMTRTYSNEEFEREILVVQQHNGKMVSKLKGDLAIKSAYLFSAISGELNTLTNTFFTKKFKA